MYLCVMMYRYQGACMKVRGQFVGVQCVNSGDKAQVTKFGSKHLYRLSRFASPS